MVLPLLLFLVLEYSKALNQDYYTAAVYEHNRQGNHLGHNAAAVIKSNLEYYLRATKLASKQGADLILFPEYGLFPPLHNRTEQKKYMEFVPDPVELSGLTPCNEREMFSDKQILYTLSCMAKKQRIVVVANMGSIEKCTDDNECPEDGVLLLNTNVVFDKNGTLIARYFKEHLFFEEGMDLPRRPQNPVFETEIGKFATFICFDIIFEKMAKTSQLQNLDAILFSTMWMDSSPFNQATQWFQAWAMGNNVTLLASNIQMPGWLATGSGIFTGRNPSMVHTHNPDGLSKLIVAKVPKKRKGGSIPSASLIAVTKNGTINLDWKNDGQDVPEVCSYDILGPPKDLQKDYRCINDDVKKYTLTKLLRPKDRLEVCHNGMCCRLDYVANGMNESYYLGVYNGTYNAYNKYFWWEENCFLARCDDVNGTACSTFPTMSRRTLFHRVSLTANFSTNYVYPSFVSNKLRLVPLEDWTFKKTRDSSSIAMYSSRGMSLIAATIKGRVYNRDPPYIR